jgi:hypothetical protein
MTDSLEEVVAGGSFGNADILELDFPGKGTQFSPRVISYKRKEKWYSRSLQCFIHTKIAEPLPEPLGIEAHRIQSVMSVEELRLKDNEDGRISNQLKRSKLYYNKMDEIGL